MNLSPEEVNNLLLEAYNDDNYSIPEFDYEVLSELPWSMRGADDFVEAGGYKISVVADVGGGEGDGSERYVVFKFAKGNEEQYFRYTGYYASWDGTTWDDLTPHEVKAKQKTITVFER